MVVRNGDELEESRPRARGINLSIGMASKIVSSQKGSLESWWIRAGSGSKLSFQNIQYSATAAISRPCHGPTVERASQVVQGRAVLPWNEQTAVHIEKATQIYSHMSGQHGRLEARC